MEQQASNNWLTTTTQRSGLNFHPLGMSCRHVVRKPADLPLYVVHQPAGTILWCMAVNKWLVLVWHDATLASQLIHREVHTPPQWSCVPVT